MALRTPESREAAAAILHPQEIEGAEAIRNAGKTGSATPSGPTPAHRIIQFDGLRAIALFLVVLYHLSYLGEGWVGVDIFFVLSGFLITSILRRRRTGPHPIRHFYSRRVRRILPPYIICLVFTSIFFSIDWRHVWYLYALPLENVARLYHPDQIGPLDPLWSLAIEEQFYLVWPLAVLSLSRRALIAILTGIIVLSPIARMIATPWTASVWTCYVLTPFRLDTISMGALLALICESPTLCDRLRRAGMPVFFAGAAALAMFQRLGYGIHHNTAIGNAVGYSILAVMSSGLVMWSTTGSGPLFRLLTWRPLRYVGTISYMSYLIHRPILQLLIGLWTSYGIRSNLAFAAAAILLTLLFATITWYTIERPLLS
jgi:peptidoglycan/LPS O-acetylase OafA/YrhL